MVTRELIPHFKMETPCYLIISLKCSPMINRNLNCNGHNIKLIWSQLEHISNQIYVNPLK